MPTKIVVRSLLSGGDFYTALKPNSVVFRVYFCLAIKKIQQLMNEYDAMEIEKLDYEPTDEELKAFNEWLDSFKNIDIALLAIHSR